MDGRIIAVFGLILLVLGGFLFAYQPTRFVPYEATETYTESEPYIDWETVEKEVPTTETYEEPVIKEVTYQKPVVVDKTLPTTQTTQQPYTYCHWGWDGWWYSYHCHTGYRTVTSTSTTTQKDVQYVTDTKQVIEYQTKTKTGTKTVEEKVPVTKYRDVEKTRTVTKYREERVMWPQYLGGALALIGLILVLVGMFVYLSEGRAQPQQVVYRTIGPQAPSPRRRGRRRKPPPKIVG
ncbi:MAG: hypothetical protein ACE5K0_09625 [Candidatus Methanofastidiosia archaeon]